MSLAKRINYFSWAARRYPFADNTCPACNSSETHPVKRKALVTVLFECDSCRLRFRVPKESEEASNAFYQEKYEQGATTECPSVSELQTLKSKQFAGSPNDFSIYIHVLRTVGLKAGDVVLDYGASWGYGSWQISNAGASVYSFEVSRSRADYARENLDCRMLNTPDSAPEPVDYFFSAHVIEHLPDPNLLWRSAASVLKPSGKIVLFMPNGDPVREQLCDYYHLLWGQVHPLLLSHQALTTMARRHGFEGKCYSSPYDQELITSGNCVGPLTGEELLFVGEKIRSV